jgi:hypothetical protein
MADKGLMPSVSFPGKLLMENKVPRNDHAPDGWETDTPCSPDMSAAAIAESTDLFPKALPCKLTSCRAGSHE